VVIGGGAMLMLVALGAAALALTPSGGEPDGPPADLLREAQRVCDGAGGGTRVEDNGATLRVDNTGSADPDGVSLTGLECILEQARVPEAVKERMFATRPQDGRRDGTWPGFRASWTYDPADGLDLTISRTA
jgi:hypothetical protein